MHLWTITARALALGFGVVALGQLGRVGGIANAAESGPETIVEQFHAALAAGDSSAAAAMLDSGAVILESGDLETRADYVAHHLAADIAFARSVRAVRQTRRADQHDGTAWVVSTSRATGNFEGRAVDSDGAELIVLRRLPPGWRIVVIHWSAHRHRP